VKGVIAFGGEDVVTGVEIAYADRANVSNVVPAWRSSYASIMMLLNVITMCACRKENVAILVS